MGCLLFHVLTVMVWPTLVSAAAAGPEERWETIDHRTGAGKRAPEGRP
jgi:hypothetical protein